MKNRARKKRGDHYFQIKISRSPVSQNSQMDNSLEHFIYEARMNKANTRKIVGPETSLPKCVFDPLRIYGIKLKKNVKANKAKANNHAPRCRSTKPNKTSPKLSYHDLEAKLAKMCLTPYQSKEITKSKDIWALSTRYNKRSPQNACPALEDTFAKMRLTPLSPQSGHDGNSHVTGTLPGPF